MAIISAVVFSFDVFSLSFADTQDTPTAVAEEEEGIDDVKYPLVMWTPKLVQSIKDGPSILSKDEIFDIKAPPANSSSETREELAYLHTLAKTKRDENTLARIHYENSGASAATIFKDEGLIDKKNYETIMLLTTIDADQFYFVLERKMHFSRPRPVQLDKTLEQVIFDPGHAAYPSGHASQTYMVALVLSDFDPENADLYKQFALDIAHRREIAGVHYPSDSEAGRKLAVDLYNKLRDVPVFEKKYQAAKQTYIKPDLKKVGFLQEDNKG